jgi:hypothetical protein
LKSGRTGCPQQQQHADAEMGALARPRLTGAPPTITGSASSGSAAVVPSCSPVEAVSAAVARPASNANGVGAPGTIRPTPFPASCAQAIGNLALVPSAIRSSSHKPYQAGGLAGDREDCEGPVQVRQ